MPISDDNDYRQRLDNFYSVLKQKLQNYRDTKQHLDRFLSTDFNVFKWTTPDEMHLSTIIAGMLDPNHPNRPHGQQRMFLDAFLRRINRCDLLSKHVDIRCEYTFRNQNDKGGRIDILCDFGDFGIGIENKPRAGDQDEQLRKYHDYLKKRYNDQFCLIYLTPDGTEPSKESIEPEERDTLMADGHLLLISYCDFILNWLRECHQRCESDKFRWFLHDLIDYIDHKMGSGTMSYSNETTIILNHALESQNNLKMALAVHSAYGSHHKRDQLLWEVIKKFKNELKRCLQIHLDMSQYEFTYKSDNKEFGTLCPSPEEYTTFGFGKNSWRRQYGIGIEYHSGTIIWGLWKPYKVPFLNSLNEAIDNEILQDGNRSDSWEWFISSPELTNEELIHMYNGETVYQLCKDLIRINKEAAPIIDRHFSLHS